MDFEGSSPPGLVCHTLDECPQDGRFDDTSVDEDKAHMGGLRGWSVWRRDIVLSGC
jgi:hypothetical protein